MSLLRGALLIRLLAALPYPAGEGYNIPLSANLLCAEVFGATFAGKVVFIKKARP